MAGWARPLGHALQLLSKPVLMVSGALECSTYPQHLHQQEAGIKAEHSTRAIRMHQALSVLKRSQCSRRSAIQSLFLRCYEKALRTIPPRSEPSKSSQLRYRQCCFRSQRRLLYQGSQVVCSSIKTRCLHRGAVAAIKLQNPMPKMMQNTQKVVLMSVTASAQNIRPIRLAAN